MDIVCMHWVMYRTLYSVLSATLPVGGCKGPRRNRFIASPVAVVLPATVERCFGGGE